MEYPGDWRLRGSATLGDELPICSKRNSKARPIGICWMLLSSIRKRRTAFGSALSFFSGRGVSLPYLPAYLICDLRGQLKGGVAQLSISGMGFDDSSRVTNDSTGARTHFDYAQRQVLHFSIARKRRQLSLTFQLHSRDENGFARPMIDQALKNYFGMNERRDGVPVCRLSNPIPFPQADCCRRLYLVVFDRAWCHNSLKGTLCQHS